AVQIKYPQTRHRRNQRIIDDGKAARRRHAMHSRAIERLRCELENLGVGRRGRPGQIGRKRAEIGCRRVDSIARLTARMSSVSHRRTGYHRKQTTEEKQRNCTAHGLFSGCSRKYVGGLAQTSSMIATSRTIVIAAKWLLKI